MKRMDSLESHLAALIVAALCAGLASPAAARDYAANGWRVPRLDGLEYLRSNRVDLDSTIPGDETIVNVFRQSDGKIIRVLHANGWIFAIVVGKNRDYEYIDEDGDGNFEWAVDGSEPKIDSVPGWVFARASSPKLAEQCRRSPDPSCEYAKKQTYYMSLNCDPKKDAKCGGYKGGSAAAESPASPPSGDSAGNGPSTAPGSTPRGSGNPISDACFCVDEKGRRFFPLFGVPDCDVGYSVRNYADCE